MVDPGGPGTHNIKPCTTLGLVDLGDTDGFDVSGIENQLYAFQLSEGTYKRKEITSNGGGVNKFSELADVNVDGVVVNKPHHLVLSDDDTWVPYPVDNWDLDFEIKQPYVSIGRNHALQKIQNSGKLLASYHTRKDLIVVNSDDFGYVIGMKGKKTGTLRLIKEFDFKPPIQGSTIVLDILLSGVPDDFVEVLKGLQIKWPGNLKNKLLRITIKIPVVDPSDQPDPSIEFSLEGVIKRPSLDKISLDFIHIGPLQLKRLRYSPHPVTII